MRTYAVKWREPDGRIFIGRLALDPRTFRLDGRRSGTEERSVNRQFGYEEILGLRIANLGAERLDGRPALLVERPGGDYLVADAGMGAPVLQELVDRLTELRAAAYERCAKAAASLRPAPDRSPLDPLYGETTGHARTGRHDMRKLFDIGGIIAGAVLIVFGAAAIYLGVNGRTTVRDSLEQEQITIGSIDDPVVAQFASKYADQQVTNGDQARAFAQVIRGHTLKITGGLTYAQMGRFLAADDPKSMAGTSDEAAALKDERGNPVANGTRDTWVTATALSTALNTSYMAEQMALFGIVVGIALLLSGVGFIVLSLALGGALLRRTAGAMAKRDGVTAKPVPTA